ncbi:MAG TPA: orotate phosphoribosyltransferase [Chloroflexia bacterium]|nr:orotate phosphoribosyltransferase [Chloroflexia bacterium]
MLPGRIQPLVEALAEKLQRHNVEAVCGPLVGGAFLAQAIASLLNVEFYYADRFAPVSTDGDTLYPVEYRLSEAVRGRVHGRAVAVVDDAISAGSAVRGTLLSLEASGAVPVAIGALLVLGNQAEVYCRERGLALAFVAQIPFDVWLPADCPLCAAGAALEDKGAP